MYHARHRVDVDDLGASQRAKIHSMIAQLTILFDLDLDLGAAVLGMARLTDKLL